MHVNRQVSQIIVVSTITAATCMYSVAIEVKNFLLAYVFKKSPKEPLLCWFPLLSPHEHHQEGECTVKEIAK